jgi:hypothetical protein
MIFLDEVPVFVMLSLRNISAERFSDVSYAEMLRCAQHDVGSYALVEIKVRTRAELVFF